MKLDIKALALLGVIIAAATFFWLAPHSGVQAAPRLPLTTIDGTRLAPEQLQGKPYLVVFWATSCSGCVKEIPQLIEMQKIYGKDGFRVLGVAMSYDEVPLLQTMRTQKGINYDIVWDQDGSIAKAFGGIMVTPTNILVSAEGKIVMQKMGEFNAPDMQQRIETLLKG